MARAYSSEVEDNEESNDEAESDISRNQASSEINVDPTIALEDPHRYYLWEPNDPDEAGTSNFSAR
ncbi:hypothetical protein ABHI18_010328 [Aspergillus niger]